jgi:hypothetical protein
MSEVCQSSPSLCICLLPSVIEFLEVGTEVLDDVLGKERVLLIKVSYYSES